VQIPPQQAGYNHTLTATDSSGSQREVVSFGEAIFCAGQSNMGMQVGPSARGFDADNATAEAAASTRYTGKIFLHCAVSRYPAAHGSSSYSSTWYSVDPVSITSFSALCWLTGRYIFDSLGGNIPVGLAMSGVGGHPIEAWLGPDQLSACGIDTDCSPKTPNSQIWSKTIIPLQPFTFGTFLWDQGEQDVSCNRIEKYSCMERQLVTSYREQFNSTFPFISIQLPGYTTGVFPMRLAQDTAAASIPRASVIATYDDSCAASTKEGCPHGFVHNEHKQTVAARAALRIRNVSLGEDLVTEGPRAVRAILAQDGPVGRSTGYTVKVTFTGGTGPFYFAGTRNCTSCCGSGSNQHASSDFSKGNTDFDVSSGGAGVSVWVNGTGGVVSDNIVSFEVVNHIGSPTWVRYTANAIFPQCALYNKEGLPAMPFEMAITA